MVLTLVVLETMAQISLVVISAKELAPYEGLYYNKKTKKPFTGRVDEYFPFQGSEKRVRVSNISRKGNAWTSDSILQRRKKVYRN